MLVLPCFVSFAGSEPSAQAALPITSKSAELSRPYQVRFGERIPVADGITLSATLVLPLPTDKPRPVILTLTPYSADRYYPIATQYASAGYVAAIVEVRGRGDSDGRFVPYENDVSDGLKVIEWLERQPFSNGDIGMRGGSYTGFLQWGLAARRPPGLKTIIPGAPPYFGVDSPSYRGVQIPYRMRWYALVAGRQRNGNLNTDREYWQGLYAELARGEIALESLDRESGIDSPYWRASLTQDYLHDLAELLPTEEELSQVSIPILSITGFYDGAQLGTLSHFRAAIAATDKKTPFYQVIGPWNHHGVSNPQSEVGGISFPEAQSRPFEWHLAWFDWVLRGGDKPEYLKDRVTYFSLGDQRWHGRQGVDQANSELKLYLSPTMSDEGIASPDSGSLHFQLEQKASSSSNQYCWSYDPGRPPISWGPYFGSLSGGDKHLLNDPLPDQLDGRGLLFTSDAFERPLQVAGSSELHVQLITDVPDTDLAAVLYALHKDGSRQTLAWDMLRARYRNGPLGEPQLLEPGKPAEFRFQLTWVAQRLEAGARLQIMLTSPGISYFFHRNRNSGGDVAKETLADTRIATLCLSPDPEKNRLELPLGSL
ncbi:MAG: CocE/NonD family hydrolase [Pseudomonadales bacterium]